MDNRWTVVHDLALLQYAEPRRICYDGFTFITAAKPKIICSSDGVLTFISYFVSLVNERKKGCSFSVYYQQSLLKMFKSPSKFDTKDL